MKLTWLTDIHLNFLETEERVQFYQSIISANCNAVLISGDIAEATSISEMLKEMASQIAKPIYFVLGNHDYYRGQIENVHKEITHLTQTETLINWLPACGPTLLKEKVALVGQDGWADGRLGNYTNSNVVLNDSRLIADLFQQRIIGKHALLDKMQQLADDDAKKLHADLIQSIDQYHPKKIIVLTHVPPFKEACTYEGKISGNDFLPFFGSKATGDVLTEIAKQNPEIEFLVLCGHTHGEAHYKPFDNLTIQAGKAEYFQPEIQSVFEV